MTITAINAQTGEVTTSQDDAPAMITPEQALQAARDVATVSRAAFLNGVVSMGIITEEVAEEAATGAWPTAFDGFLSGLTAAQRIEAKALWADGGDVRRSSPLLASIAAAEGVTDAQLDTLFGLGA